MNFIALKKDEFEKVYEQMTKAFIQDEIRYFDDAFKLLDNEDYKIYHIIYNEKRVGFISIWDLKDFYFVEHFVFYSKKQSNCFGKYFVTC